MHASRSSLSPKPKRLTWFWHALGTAIQFQRMSRARPCIIVRTPSLHKCGFLHFPKVRNFKPHVKPKSASRHVAVFRNPLQSLLFQLLEVSASALLWKSYFVPAHASCLLFFWKPTMTSGCLCTREFEDQSILRRTRKVVCGVCPRAFPNCRSITLMCDPRNPFVCIKSNKKSRQYGAMCCEKRRESRAFEEQPFKTFPTSKARIDQAHVCEVPKVSLAWTNDFLREETNIETALWSVWKVIKNLRSCPYAQAESDGHLPTCCLRLSPSFTRTHLNLSNAGGSSGPSSKL
jgi:hypothetical protein